MKYISFLLIILTVSAFSADFKTIDFSASDSVTIRADLYMPYPDSAPFILLFHQAGWSRGEYREIAPHLNQLGFNCMAIDQRSGGEVNNVFNETFRQANLKKKATTYLDAITDLESAIAYSRAHFAKGDLLLWGSSYSAALALKIAGENPAEFSGVLAFAPGEYFQRLGKSDTFITESAKKITCPVFVTSAREEADRWKAIYAAIPAAVKQNFIPATEGNHGSRALWKKFSDSPAYWKAVEKFLKANFPADSR
jgi:dienelactone hydrolase